jgi:hypothetical protein
MCLVKFQAREGKMFSLTNVKQQISS